MDNNGFTAGTPVLMFDGTYRNIESLEVGDLLLGPPECIDEYQFPHVYHPYHDARNYIPSRVTSISTCTAETLKVDYEFGGQHDGLFTVTKNQRFLTCGGDYLTMEEIVNNQECYIFVDKQEHKPYYTSQTCYYELKIHSWETETIYHIETSTHTYIAVNAIVHD